STNSRDPPHETGRADRARVPARGEPPVTPPTADGRLPGSEHRGDLERPERLLLGGLRPGNADLTQVGHDRAAQGAVRPPGPRERPGQRSWGYRPPNRSRSSPGICGSTAAPPPSRNRS